MEEEAPVPPQLKQPALHDFRGAPTAQRGFLMKNKRKLEDYAEQARLNHFSRLLPQVPSHTGAALASNAIYPCASPAIFVQGW